MYALLEDLRAYIGAVGTEKDALLTQMLGTAEAIIDAHCGRSFGGTNATRYYMADAVRGAFLHLDADLVSVASVSVGGVTATSGQYQAYPLNSTPKTKLRALGGLAWVASEDEPISVTGLWGYGDGPPQDVTQAAIRLAAFLFRQKDTNADLDRPFVADSGTIILPPGIPADVRQMLAPYRRRTL